MKNIILLSDGTGNSAAKKNKTNVWRLYSALDMHDENQIAMYDDGVGSKESTWSKILGGAFGFGLKRNVIELYKFLCRNYRTAEEYREKDKENKAKEAEDYKDDKIYLFGFSRGAFTVRVLAGFVASAGLCTNYKTEKELHQWAVDNYRNYRNKYKHGYLSKVVNFFLARKPKNHCSSQPQIEFIGVWDTVDAYVFAIDELAILWNFFIYPIRFSDKNLSVKINRACHAISLDDERHTFHPVVWNENGAKEDRIEQVWFAGVHADVGGGYPEQSLSLVPLDWMLSRVEADDAKDGLVFIKDIRDRYHKQSDWNGPQHNSRSGLGAYYRYKPRNIEHICNDKGIEKPRIHRSVFERIKSRAAPYAPTGVPGDYEVAITKGDVPVFEHGKEGSARASALNYALDVIFWRRGLYFALLVVTVGLLSLRFFVDWDEGGICKGSACFIDPVLQLVIGSLPQFAVGWVEVLRQNPVHMWAIAGLFFVLFILRGYARSRTLYHAMRAWAKIKKDEDVPTWSGSLTALLRKLEQSKLKFYLDMAVAAVFFFIIVYLILAVANGIAFHLRYTSGMMCKSSKITNIVTSPTATVLDIRDACKATGIKIEKGRSYRFDVADAILFDGPKLQSSPDGITPASLYGYVPLRRHLGSPWLRLYGKVGNAGYEEIKLGKGITEYSARSDGELFLYVNDAVFGVYPKWDLPYRWEQGKNKGEVRLTISKLKKQKN